MIISLPLIAFSTSESSNSISFHGHVSARLLPQLKIPSLANSYGNGLKNRLLTFEDSDNFLLFRGLSMSYICIG